MRYGFIVPFASEQEFVELARLGEQHGWDAVFSWEGVWRQDAWVQLAAAATATTTLRLGTVITPVSRYRPWDLASVIGSVDRLSGGRVQVGVGLGAINSNWTAFEPEESRTERASRVDEALQVFAQLCSGEPFRHDGRHWSIDLTNALEPEGPPPTIQRPHPPVWCVGALVPGRSRQRSLERAARWQGCIPAIAGGPDNPGLTLEGLAEIITQLRGLRADLGLAWDGYDIVIGGDSFGAVEAPADRPQDWEAAGATWWVESWWDVPPGPDGVAELQRRVTSGPPG